MTVQVYVQAGFQESHFKALCQLPPIKSKKGFFLLLFVCFVLFFLHCLFIDSKVETGCVLKKTLFRLLSSFPPREPEISP